MRPWLSGARRGFCCIASDLQKAERGHVPGSLLRLAQRVADGEGSRVERDAARRLILAAASEDKIAEAQYVHGLLNLQGQWKETAAEEVEVEVEESESVIVARQSVLKELKELKKKAKKDKRQRRAEERQKAAGNRDDGMVIRASEDKVAPAPPDPMQIATESFELAAVQGYQKAQTKLGLLLLDAEEPGKAEMAVEWLELAVGVQHPTPDPNALLYLGLIFMDSADTDSTGTPKKAMQHLTLAAEAGQTDAQFWVGHYNRVGCGGTPIDGQKALQWMSTAATPTEGKTGLGKAMHYLAQLHGEGDSDAGINADPQLMWKWLRAGEASGYGDTLFFIGDLHYHGGTEAEDGIISVDRKLAARYYFRATGLLNDNTAVSQEGEQESDDAEHVELRGKVVQAMRTSGMDVSSWTDGVEHSSQPEGGLSKEDGEGLHSDALASLAAMFYHGDGVKQNYTLAFMLYQRAAIDNHFIAWRNIASMYALGHGVEKDEHTAKYLLGTLQKQMQEALEEQSESVSRE
jgi:TPR repeat protein